MAGLPALPVFNPDPVTEGLQVYVVGGAVRDALLGLPAGDCDWVVVGATPEAMTERGFVPVGGDFPVFLHPRTHQEYALARTERKSGRGYQGFTFYTGPEVSLADDLRRRDLTVNAIAQTREGQLVDPLNGVADVQARILRHVGDAFVEDPVRLLRLARFAARFTDFDIAPETLALARRMVEDGEVDALVPERVWREISRGLTSDNPLRLFEVLASTGALARVMPGFVMDAQLGGRLACAVAHRLTLPARFALACLASPQPELLARHLKAPTDVIDFARLLPLAVQGLDQPLAASAVLSLVEQLDGLRKPERFTDLVQAAACVLPDDFANTLLPRWLQGLQTARAVDAGAVARACAGRAGDIKAAVRAARLEALLQLLPLKDGRGDHPA
ncbi:MAG: hypothetical protein WDA26_08480 [Pusillimonas sp.]